MASRFLRADFRRAFRSSSPQTNSGSTLYFASRERRQPAPTSRTISGRVVAGLASPGWQCTSVSQSLGHASRALSASSGGVVANTSSSSTTTTKASSRFGSVNSVTSSTSASIAGLHSACWRRAGEVALCSRQSQAGRRYLSSRRGKAGQTLTNRSITAKELLLVLETKDGSKETTLVTRQQALDAAEAANLDLVQVSGKSNPVVCRLMDFKRDEYRKLKMHKKRASEKRVQKKKEIRLRGMIASHDFDRKVKDVKKYLDRGDIVRVVLEANTSLLKRSGNCLNELQENFEAEMEALEGVVMKHSGGGNGYTRREIECIPKTIKASSTKAAKVAMVPAADEEGSEEGALTPPRPPPTRVVDDEIVREILSGTVSARTSTAAAPPSNQAERQSEGNDPAPSPPSSGPGESSRENSSGKDWGEGSSDDEELLVDDDTGAGKEKEDATLKLGSIVIPVRDVQYYDDITEEDAKADEDEMEWERQRARQRESRRKKEINGRSGDGSGRRGGAAGGGGGGRGGRRKWRAGLDDMDGDLDGEPEDVDDDIRRRPRSPRTSPSSSSPRKAGQKGATSQLRANDASGPGGRAGAGGFAVRERPGGLPSSAIAGPRQWQRQGGFARGREGGGGGGGSRGGGVNGSWVDGRRGEGGRRGGGRGLAPPAAPPVRTTPYKWRTSLADQAGATEGVSVQQQQQQQQQPLYRRGTGSPSGGVAALTTTTPASASAASQDGGRGALEEATDAGVNDGGQIRGFRARFGGAVAGRPAGADAGAGSDSS